MAIVSAPFAVVDRTAADAGAQVRAQLVARLDAIDTVVSGADGLTTLIRQGEDGVTVGKSDSGLQARVANTGFEVIDGGEVVTELGARQQRLGSLMIFETADGGHAFVHREV